MAKKKPKTKPKPKKKKVVKKTQPTSQGLPPTSGYGVQPGQVAPGSTPNTPTGWTPPPATATAPAAPTGVSSATWLAELFNSWGVPQDIQNKLIQIFTTYGGDTEASSREAFAYIRNTDWYKNVAFVGIEAGVTSGALNSATREADYMRYVIAANNAAQKYFGRNATNAEVAEYLSKGYTESYIPNIYGSQSYASTGDFSTSNLALGSFGEGELTAAQKLELGKTQFGIGTEIGTKIQEAIARAQKRLETMYGGQTGGLTESKVQKPKDIDLQA